MRENERRGGRQRGAGRVMRTGSINRKYSAGYLLMLSITLLMFALSFVTTELLSARHRKTVDFLLELNSLFIDVENTNRAVYDYYLYLIPASGEEYTSASGTTRQALDALYERMGEEYSREVVDLCCMVDTFLTQSQQLIGQLSALRSAGSVEDNASIARLYAKTQDTISYINQSFQEAYTQQLTQVQRTQEQNDRMQTVLSGFLMGMLVLALLVCLFFYRRVVIGITGAVNRLTDFAAKVTKKPASQEHIQLDTGDELSVLAGAFNEMLDTIHAQMNQIQTDSQMREQLQRVEMENLRISAALQSQPAAAAAVPDQPAFPLQHPQHDHPDRPHGGRGGDRPADGGDGGVSAVQSGQGDQGGHAGGRDREHPQLCLYPEMPVRRADPV